MIAAALALHEDEDIFIDGLFRTPRRMSPRFELQSISDERSLELVYITNGYRDLPWKLNAAERSADHIASLCAEIWKRWTANTHCRNTSTWTCPSGAAKFDLYTSSPYSTFEHTRVSRRWPWFAARSHALI